MTDTPAQMTIYHNPRCSKSRATLALLAASGERYRIIEYLSDPPNAGQIRDLLGKLGLPANRLVRRGEPQYAALFGDVEPDEAALIEAMARYPILIERPVVVRGAHAVICRPPENLQQLLEPR
ncbi:MAG: arsenate reductase (glutaredoxin) [Steroidobacteraceae bacterium]